MEDDNQNSSIIALKIIMALSLILVGMDLLEVYFSYISLKAFSREFNHEIFEECIKYHMFTQIVFTVFATMAGISAFIMSAGLLISHDFFATKALDSFVNFNFNIFGPYLLTMSIFGFTYYDKILYNCSREDFNIKHINFSTLLALAICFFISFFITFVFSFIEGYRVLLRSIRFSNNGYRFIGKFFWRYVFNRRRDEFQQSQNAIDHQFNILYNPDSYMQRENNHNNIINYNEEENRNNLINHQHDIELSNLNIINRAHNIENRIISQSNENQYSNNDLEEHLNPNPNGYSEEEKSILGNEDFSNINFNDVNQINLNIQNNKNILYKDRQDLK